MTDAIDLTKEQHTILTTLVRRFLPGVAVWAYGSRVKWTAHPNSDLDLVAFTTPAHRAEVADLKDALAESNLPFLVDLHVWDDVPERFCEIIRKEYVVVQEAKEPGSGSNMAGWKDMTLGDFVALQRGHDLTESERRPGNIPVMGSAGQNGFHDTALAKGPGIVIGRSGASFGQVHFCTTDYWPHNTGLYVTDFKGNAPRFAYYLLKVLDLERYNSGSAQPSLNRNFIYPIPICVPEPTEQKAIAHILGTLDDKIELNRRMNETLEAMARALFKSWFVDFDPVRAKAEGRDPGLPKHLADLFPDSFEDSELGEIPRGWEVVNLNDVTEINYGKNLPQNELLESGTPVFGAAGVIGYYREVMFMEPIVLVTSRGSGSGTVHETQGPSFVTNNSFSVIPKDGWFSRHYLKASLLNSEISSLVTGSAQPQLTITNFSYLKLVRPAEGVVRQFHYVSEAFWQKKNANQNKSHTLAALRDTLLPKLISGELRVPQETINLEGQA